MLLCIKKNVIKKMLVGFKNVTQAKKKKKKGKRQGEIKNVFSRL